MATVGHLNINVNARTAKFHKKMKGVRARIKTFATGILGVIKKLVLFGVAAAAAAAAALIAFTKMGITSVDKLGKVSTKLGLAAKDLQVLRLAATSTGITIETLDMALQRMARRVGEAAVGTGEAQGALEELGLSAKELNNLSTDEVFYRVADAMKDVTNTQDRLRLSMKLFDSEGAALHTTMIGGRDALMAYRAEAEKLGILLESKQVKAVEALKTKIGFVHAAFIGFTQHLAVQFAPMLTLVTNKITGFIQSFGGVDVMAEVVVLSVAKMGQAVFNMLNKVHSGWLTFKAAIVAGGGQILEWWGDIFDDQVARDMAKAMFDEAGGLLLDADSFVPFTDIEAKLKALRDKLEGMGIDDDMELNIVGLPDLAANFKGAAENLSTAIGSMKVEGDSQSRILSQTLNIEKEHLQTSKDTLNAIRSGGVVLT